VTVLHVLLTGTVVADPDTVYEDGAVAVEGDTVAAVGPRESVADRYAGHERRSFDVVCPGLVAGHVHTVQSVARGIADDAGLEAWLRDAVLPAEAALDESGVRAAAELGALELLESGVTTCIDHLTTRHAGAAIEAAGEAGLRGRFGKVLLDDAPDAPAALTEDADAALAETRALVAAHHGTFDGRVRYAVTPRYPLGCSRECLQGVRELAADHPGVTVHTHAAETRAEVAETRRRRGARPVELLDDVGLLGPDTVVAHAVWTTERERERLAETGTHVAHCPSANMKLASGVAPVPAYRRRGIPVALGNDGPPCNNTLDPFTELRQACLLHRVDRLDATVLGARDAFEMATLAGASAAGFDRLGALRPGWRADVVGLRTDRARATPTRDPVDHLAFSARGDDVAFSMVGGEVVVADGTVQTLDSAAVRERASAVADALPSP
jgi:cytosine/adenosine deaminase-related metal-dependent hydrolase